MDTIRDLGGCRGRGGERQIPVLRWQDTDCSGTWVSRDSVVECMILNHDCFLLHEYSSMCKSVLSLVSPTPNLKKKYLMHPFQRENQYSPLHLVQTKRILHPKHKHVLLSCYTKTKACTHNGVNPHWLARMAAGKIWQFTGRKQHLWALTVCKESSVSRLLPPET